VEPAIFALFDDALAALNVASALERNGYKRERISLLVPDPRGRYAPPQQARERGARGPRVFGAISIPGLGPAAITGPLSGAIGDGGGLVESLTGLGLPEPAARHYLESMRRGQAVLALESPEGRTQNAIETMRRLGARAVDETGASHVLRAEMGASEPRAPLDQVTVPVMEEHLEVGKRKVQRGGVRIHSQIVEEPIRENISLREDRVTVERRPVDRDATEADLADFKEGSIEFHETVEEPVISKRKRVVEEIVIGKETRERTETISETVRKTQVSVEPLRAGEASSGSPPAEGQESDALGASGTARGERSER
jgi:uncharacterized protein (TIGR02271 family)